MRPSPAWRVCPRCARRCAAPSAIFWPQAELKVWLDASPEERRRRRAAERGEEAGDTALERDRKDAAQMIVPADSICVDTEGRSIEQVIEAIVQLSEERA